MTFATRIRHLLRRESLPKSRVARIAIGILFVVGGIVGLLPILGFWMIPLGLTILAVDIPFIRPYARRINGALKRIWNKVFEVKR